MKRRLVNRFFHNLAFALSSDQTANVPGRGIHLRAECQGLRGWLLVLMGSSPPQLATAATQQLLLSGELLLVSAAVIHTGPSMYLSALAGILQVLPCAPEARS
jgi:hypothetical protein